MVLSGALERRDTLWFISRMFIVMMIHFLNIRDGNLFLLGVCLWFVVRKFVSKGWDDMKLWIVGQLRGRWNKGRCVWDFQGVFQSRRKAVAACRTKKYFIFSARLNESYPHEECEGTDGCYPLA